MRRRQRELVEDKLQLPPTGRGSVGGHRIAYRQTQRHLQKLLKEALARGCHNLGATHGIGQLGTLRTRAGMGPRTVLELNRSPHTRMISESEKEAIVDAWIRLQNSVEGSAEYEANLWAGLKIWRLKNGNPNDCWAIILAIIDKDRSDEVLDVLAAGPMEDLLVEHGAQFIEVVEKQAHKDQTFRRMLQGVWQNAMPEDVWQRVLVASGRKALM